MLWSEDHPAQRLIDAAPMLSQAFLYADRVTLVAATGSDFLEYDDATDLVDVLGQNLQLIEADFFDFEQFPAVLRAIAGIYGLEAASCLRQNQPEDALRQLRVASSALSVVDQTFEDLDGLRNQLDSRGWDPEPLFNFIRTNSLEAPMNTTEEDLNKVRQAAVIHEFFSRALDPQSYGLVDDARGVWEDQGIQDTLLPSGRRSRASAASLAIGQMQRLPSARAIDWRVTADLRRQLGEPLARFRAAMGKLAASDSPNPLDQAFDDFIETIWMTEVAPALAELEDLSRQGQLREVFFDDVSGKLTTYAGPAIALIGGSIAGAPLYVQGALAATGPLLSSISAQRMRRRIMRSRDFYFLHAIEKRLRERR